MQAEFVRELFTLCHEEGLHTCLDTSGCILNESTEALLDVTDRVLLDVKYTSDELYRRYVGCSMQTPMAFLNYLRERHIPTTVRQVIIPTINDSEEQILELKTLLGNYSNVDTVELLPFRKICQVKYDKLGIPFPMAHIPEPTKGSMFRLESRLLC